MSERRLSEIAQRSSRQPEGIVGKRVQTRINKAARQGRHPFRLVAAGFPVASVRQERAEGKYACGSRTAPCCPAAGRSARPSPSAPRCSSSAILTCRDLKAIWTAHHTRTCDETFADMCELDA